MSYAFTSPSARIAGPSYAPVNASPLSPKPGAQSNYRPAPSPTQDAYRPSLEGRASPSGAYLLPPSPSYAHSTHSRSSSEDMHSNPFDSPPSPSPDPNSISGKFSLSPDPKSWGAELSPDYHEYDDYLHTPDKRDTRGHIFTVRGLMNLGCLFILASVLIGLFAGFPIISWFLKKKPDTLGGYNLGGINGTGQVMQTQFSLIDAATPQDAMTYKSTEDGTDWQLVFSDEFETEGRTFYPGDDPFWEAVDLHYWGTNNLEYYDPETITTTNGHLQITMKAQANHGLDYMGGMMSSWNKFCFTGGILLASVVLPGSSTVPGLWPAIWAMGNLGRAGYGASLDGMWPYSYEACDLGTLANQTYQGGPEAALTSGDPGFNGELSYLPGQRLSACTCQGEDHPGPVNRDGTFVGRAAPEIDVFEAQVTQEKVAHVSQSCQWAPFNAAYTYNNVSYTEVDDATVTQLNEYKGSVYQQASSALSLTDTNCYELGTGCYSTYGFEYKPGFDADSGYISWINNGKRAWSLRAGAMQADPVAQISARPVPKEPMYIILNLGMSENFGEVDFANLVFPVHLLVDWIRVYQRADRVNIGCDPTGYPTSNYINRYIEAYSNPNLTTWVNDYGQQLPKNKMVDTC